MLKIIDQYSSSERSNDPAYIAAYLYRKLPIAILECAVLTGVVPFLLSAYLSQTTFNTYVVSDLDNAFGVFDPVFLKEELVADPNSSVGIAISLYNQALFMIIAIFLVTLKPLWEISNRFFYKTGITNPGFDAPASKRKEYGRQYSKYELMSGSFALLVGMISVIHFELLDHVLSNASKAPLSISFSAICSFLACEFSLFMWIACSRKRGRYSHKIIGDKNA